MSVAGEVADLAFYAAAERPFILRPRTRRDNHILAHVRFKDDGLIVCKKDRLRNRQLFWNFDKETSFFKLTCESIGRDEFTMLDVRFFKGPKFSASGQLDYELYRKPSQVWKPLSILSCHHPSVHSHWPVGHRARIFRRFSCSLFAREEISRFEAQYKEINGVEEEVEVDVAADSGPCAHVFGPDDLPGSIKADTT